MFRADLAAAGIAPVDEEGRRIDFHALRHTFITHLAQAGVRPKDAQTLARHSTITLTLDRYTHTGLSDVAGAVEKLPTRAAPARQAAEATGTTGDAEATSGGPLPAPSATKSCPHGRTQTGGEQRRIGTNADDAKPSKTPPRGRRQPPAGEAVRRTQANREETSGGGIRTPDTRIMIPLL